MKKSILIPLILALFILAGLVYILWPRAAEAPQGKVQSIESYLSQEINKLAKEQSQLEPVLGGTFHVTAIELTATGAGVGTGVVEYEDGHMAYTADFSYSADDFRGVEIEHFIVRK